MGEWISVKDKLPPANTYVLVHYSGGNHRDGDDQFGCECRVMKFVKDSNMEVGNNLRPYRWLEFGPGSLFGQDVDYWQLLPRKPQ